LSLTQQTKGGHSTYEVRHDVSNAGLHHVDLLLWDTPIQGSPVSFTVLPDKPDPVNTKLKPPADETLLIDNEYVCVIKTSDRFGNPCISGGLSPQVRAQVIKTGVHDQTALVPNNHTISNPAEDMGNGEYFIRIKTSIRCSFKLNVNIDKNLPSAGGDLPPITITIHDPNPPEEKEAAQGRRSSGRASAVLKSAVGEIMDGFGEPDERREKDPLLVAVGALAEGAPSFDFDSAAAEKAVSEALQGSFKGTRRPSTKGMSPDASPTSLRRSESTSALDQRFPPNKSLFDKEPSSPTPSSTFTSPDAERPPGLARTNSRRKSSGLNSVGAESMS